MAIGMKALDCLVGEAFIQKPSASKEAQLYRKELYIDK